MTPPLGLKSGLWPKSGHLPTQLFALPMRFAIGFIEIGGELWTLGRGDSRTSTEESRDNRQSGCTDPMRSDSDESVFNGIDRPCANGDQPLLVFFLRANVKPTPAPVPKERSDGGATAARRPQASLRNGRQPKPHDFGCHQLAVRTSRGQLSHPDGQCQ